MSQSIFIKAQPKIQTNLSIALSWPDDFNENANAQYTVTLSLTGVIWSPNTVATVTLPAGVSFVSATWGGTHDSWVITWSLWDLMAGTAVNFTITSDTPDEYELLANVASDFANIGTASDSKEIEVEAWWPTGIELRASWLWFNPTAILWVNSLSLNWVSVLSSFTLDVADLWWWVRRLGYLDTWVWTWDLEIEIATPEWPEVAQSRVSYNETNPTVFSDR